MVSLVYKIWNTLHCLETCKLVVDDQLMIESATVIVFRYFFPNMSRIGVSNPERSMEIDSPAMTGFQMCRSRSSQ